MSELSYFILFIYLFIYFIGFFVCLFFVLRDRVSLYSPGCPGTHSVDQAGLELRNLPASTSTSQVLGLKACATTPSSHSVSYYHGVISVYREDFP